MVAVTILVVVLCTFALLGYVVHKIDLKRFRASGELGWKRVAFAVEADAGTAPDEAPDGSRRALPEGRSAAS